MNSSAWPYQPACKRAGGLVATLTPAAAAELMRLGVKVDTKPPARLHAGRYRHADQLLRRRPGPSLHRSGALEPRQGMLLNNRRPASFRPPARNRNQTSDQKVGSCKSLIRASDQTFRLNPADTHTQHTKSCGRNPLPVIYWYYDPTVVETRRREPQ